MKDETKEFKTIKELADELGISKDKAKYQVRKLPSKLTTKKDGIIYIESTAIDIIREAMSRKLPSELTSKLPFDYLHLELRKKDTELEIKNKQIESLIEGQTKLQKIIDQQQQLQLKTQKMLEEKMLLLETKEQKKWWSFWK